ncbi:PilZ domain-containing protein [uncultured Desulfobacter sp.]|uniref:PilZ domain-containing protein n=1 Tax=uncultured Desulfobacter sp. TaxID=240139 RepID=UPI0029C8EB04|nr:PilZ domain-containing protein [uncultured Desulfobacter sp.]
MKKRSCNRFYIPGATLHYRESSFFFLKGKFTQDYFPVINLSKGGAKFLSNKRLTPGKDLLIRLNIPGQENSYEIMADVRWISRNPEQSYKYQTGISFKSFGNGRKKNSKKILDFLTNLENSAGQLESPVENLAQRH